MHEGYLSKRSDGRYGLDDGYYWTCGCHMVLFYDGVWLTGRVEHDGNYYFMDGKNKIYLHNGLLARSK